MGTQVKRFYYKQNRLKQLRAFCYAAQVQSISKAAERLHLSQPSVSLQVRALERELSTTLFERKGPRISLTPEGQALFELAIPLVEGMDRLPDAFDELRGDVGRGELDIAAGESTILYILPRFVQRFAAQYPRVRLKLRNVTGRDGLAQVRADEVDFAVGALPDVPRDIEYQPIFEYETLLITSPRHPLAALPAVTLEDIAPHGLILPPRNLATWSAVDLVFRQHRLEPRVIMEAGGWEVIKRYVSLDVGVAIVSGVCITGDEGLVARPLGKYFPDRSYGVVMRREKFLSPAAKRFIRMMDPSFFASHARNAK